MLDGNRREWNPIRVIEIYVMGNSGRVSDCPVQVPDACLGRHERAVSLCIGMGNWWDKMMFYIQNDKIVNWQNLSASYAEKYMNHNVMGNFHIHLCLFMKFQDQSSLLSSSNECQDLKSSVLQSMISFWHFSCVFYIFTSLVLGTSSNFYLAWGLVGPPCRTSLCQWFSRVSRVSVQVADVEALYPCNRANSHFRSCSNRCRLFCNLQLFCFSMSRLLDFV